MKHLDLRHQLIQRMELVDKVFKYTSLRIGKGFIYNSLVKNIEPSKKGNDKPLSSQEVEDITQELLLNWTTIAKKIQVNLHLQGNTIPLSQIEDINASLNLNDGVKVETKRIWWKWIFNFVRNTFNHQERREFKLVKFTKSLKTFDEPIFAKEVKRPSIKKSISKGLKRLSEKQLKIYNLLKSGKTIKQIQEIMGGNVCHLHREKQKIQKLLSY